MKTEHIPSVFWAAVLSFLISAGVAGSVVTGLALPAKLLGLILCCGALAIFCALCLYYEMGWLPAALLASSVLLRPMRLQLRTFAAAIMDRLHSAYGVPMPEYFMEDRSATVWLALLLIGGIGGFLAARSVIRQKSCFPAAIAALLPMCSCITVVDTVPHRRWLFVWAMGLMLLLMTQSTRRRDREQGAKLISILALPLAAFLLLLFWLVPPQAPGCWDFGNLPERILDYLDGPEPTPVPGPSEQATVPKVDLSALSTPQKGSDVIMEVTSSFSGPLYLRTQDYDRYTGDQWESSKLRLEFISHNRGFYQGTVTITTPTVLDYLYLPSFPLGTVTMRDGYCGNSNKSTSYSFHCQDPQREATLAYQDPGYLNIDVRYLELDTQTRAAAEAYLADYDMYQWNGFEKAEQIRKIVSQSAVYDLDTPNMPADQTDLAMWFLNQSDTGYCVHFATAAAVLLRASGVPARYVRGYLVHVKENQTIEVKEEHAHAWVEYYVQDVGWELLEATPSAPSQEPEPTTQPTEPDVTEPSNPKPPKQNRFQLPQWCLTLLRRAALIAGVLLVIWVQYALRRYLFRLRCRRGSFNRQGLVIYRRAARLVPWLQQPIPLDLLLSAQIARFSRHTLSQDQLDALRHWLWKSEQQLRSLPLMKKLLVKWVFAYY